MAWTGNSSLVVVFYALHFFYSREYKTDLLILRISLISCYHSCLLCKRIWRLIYYANGQLNCCDQICDLQSITRRYEENYRYLILPLRISLHQITNNFPHCGLATFLVYWYIDLGSTVGQFHITLVKIAAPAFWNRTCDMTIPPAKWRSQMRLEIPPALWESHLRSEDRRCVLKSHLRYENRTCELKIADAFWNPAAALWESHLRSEGRRCVLKTHLRPSLRRPVRFS